MCHSNLLMHSAPPKDASKVYCPVCGWRPRQEKTATTTRTKLLEQKAEMDAVLPEKGTKHDLGNGYHVYFPETMYDVAREGTLMENCTSDEGCHNLQRDVQEGRQDPAWTYDKPYWEEGDPSSWWIPAYLRDNDGIPHAMWTHYHNYRGDPVPGNQQAEDAEGRRGQPLKPEYIQMLRQYYDPEGDPDYWHNRFGKTATIADEFRTLLGYMKQVYKMQDFSKLYQLAMQMQILGDQLKDQVQEQYSFNNPEPGHNELLRWMGQWGDNETREHWKNLIDKHVKLQHGQFSLPGEMVQYAGWIEKSINDGDLVDFKPGMLKSYTDAAIKNFHDTGNSAKLWQIFQEQGGEWAEMAQDPQKAMQTGDALFELEMHRSDPLYQKLQKAEWEAKDIQTTLDRMQARLDNADSVVSDYYQARQPWQEQYDQSTSYPTGHDPESDALQQAAEELGIDFNSKVKRRLSGFRYITADIAEVARERRQEAIQQLREFFGELNPSYQTARMLIQNVPDQGYKLIPWLMREITKRNLLDSQQWGHANDIIQQATKWFDWSREHNKPLPEFNRKDFGFEQMQNWVYEMNNSQAQEGEEGEWPDSQPVYEWPDGWHMDRVGPNDLAREGELMGHCVGGYCDVVRSGGTSIYSLRDPKGHPHVTIEVDGDPPITQGYGETTWQPRTVTVVQVQGKQDTEPIPEYRQKVDEWFEHLHNQGWEVDEQDPEREPEMEYREHERGPQTFEDPDEVIEYGDRMKDKYDREYHYGDDEDPEFENNTYWYQMPRRLDTSNLYDSAIQYMKGLQSGEYDEDSIAHFGQSLWLATIHNRDYTQNGTWGGTGHSPFQDGMTDFQNLVKRLDSLSYANPPKQKQPGLFDMEPYTAPRQNPLVAQFMDYLHQLEHAPEKWQTPVMKQVTTEPSTQWPTGENLYVHHETGEATTTSWENGQYNKRLEEPWLDENGRQKMKSNQVTFPGQGNWPLTDWEDYFNFHGLNQPKWSKVAQLDAPLENPVSYQFIPWTDQEIQTWDQEPRSVKYQWRRNARNLTRGARTRGYAGTVTGRDLYLLNNRYQGKCAYCGLPGADSWDHVVPLSQGGEHSPSNILPAHIECNKELNQWAKRNQDYENPNIHQMSPNWFVQPAEAKVAMPQDRAFLSQVVIAENKYGTGVNAKLNGETIGYLNVGFRHGQYFVTGIYVNPEYQRKGLATEMFRQAPQLLGLSGLVHDEPDRRSLEGERWVQQTPEMPLEAHQSAPKTIPTEGWSLTSAGEDFTQFFEDASRGQYAPSQPYVPTYSNPEHKAFDQTWRGYSGNFDQHIDTSIPDYREQQTRKAVAITKTFGSGAKMIDLGSSEGSFGKAITDYSRGGVQTDNLDPNDAMEQHFNTTPVPQGAQFVKSYFGEHNPGQIYDVVHESMLFQFIGPERQQHIAQAKDLLQPNGLLLVDEKVITDNFDQNEAEKDQWKSQFYSPEQLQQKQDVVKVQKWAMPVKPPGEWPKDWEWPSMPKYVYHATPVSNVPTILKKGLIPQVSEQMKSYWPEAQPYIHAVDNMEDLEDRFHDYLREKNPREQLAVLQIPAKHFNYWQGIPDPEWGALDDQSGREQFTWVTDKHIPPDDIKVIDHWPEPEFLESKVAMPPNPALLSRLRFEWQDLDGPSGTLVAYDGDRQAGFVEIENYRIWGLEVDPKYQRQGLATELYNQALQEFGNDLVHGDLTDQGRSWLEATEPGAWEFSKDDTYGEHEDEDEDSYWQVYPRTSGMIDNMVHKDDLEQILRQYFKYVKQTWDSGNFVGYAASDNPQTLETYVSNL
jgi:ribosomal protein S18 acetylase RimI-like enzyme